MVIEPNDTAARTVNLRQTNTAGYKFQGTPEAFEAAKKLVAEWGEQGSVYLPTSAYQALLARLMGTFPYRLDTNFAKMDRIVHGEIEEFKRRTYETKMHGRTIGEWNQLLSRGGEEGVALALADAFGIREGKVESVIE